MHRQRYNYWSHSRLSKYIRTKFGLGNPYALSAEDWQKHKDSSAEKSPIINWITDKGFNKLQNIVMFIPDLWFNIRTATIWKFFRNLWMFRKCLWNYRSWDYSGMMNFMITSAKDMSEVQEKYGHHVGHLKTAKELKVFVHVLERVRDDIYTEDKLAYTNRSKGFGMGVFTNKPNTLPSYRNPRQFYKLTGQQRKDDLSLACKLMERKLLSWWD